MSDDIISKTFRILDFLKNISCCQRFQIIHSNASYTKFLRIFFNSFLSLNCFTQSWFWLRYWTHSSNLSWLIFQRWKLSFLKWWYFSWSYSSLLKLMFGLNVLSVNSSRLLNLILNVIIRISEQKLFVLENKLIEVLSGRPLVLKSYII